jgi:2-amino-4-hydroxy-6-hydroxymethyldihydropteridine diphosphokinase
MSADHNHAAPRVTAYLGLGSNLAEPLWQLTRALQAIEEIRDVRLTRVSSFYETAPVGMVNQPNFVNAVAEIDTTLSPRALLAALLEIEAAQARVRTVKNGPRTLDLDILLYGDQRIHEEALAIPHPRMHQRAFVLVPLAEVRPDVMIPGHGTASALLAQCDCRGVRQVGEPQQTQRQQSKA